MRFDMRTGVEGVGNFCLAGKEGLRTLGVMNALCSEDEELAKASVRTAGARLFT